MDKLGIFELCGALKVREMGVKRALSNQSACSGSNITRREEVCNLKKLGVLCKFSSMARTTLVRVLGLLTSTHNFDII